MAGSNSGPSRRELLAGASMLAAMAAAPARAQEPEINVGGKSVLVTGSSSGFGYAASLYLARAGAQVIASMRNFQDGARPEAQALADIASQENLNLSLLEIDVTNPAQIESGVAETLERTGGSLDGLVNNAGLAGQGPVEMFDGEELERLFQTNVFGYQRMVRAVLPPMRARREGLLIQISSQLGRITRPTSGMYSSTKFAVEAMFEALAYELAPFGVEAVIVQPGAYRGTKLVENGRTLFEALEGRADAERRGAYAEHIDAVRAEYGAGGTASREDVADSDDVSRAIAQLLSLPAGRRPLREVVHPTMRVAERANTAMAELQAMMLANGPYAEWHRAVTDA